MTFSVVLFHRRNNAYETKCKKREEGFAVRSGVAHIPHTFDAFRADRANKAAQKPLSKEKSASSYRSLLEEADREGDEEAAMIAMMGGTHPLVAIARQKSSDIAAPDGGAVFLEPSFASAARHGAATSTLPPLGRHLVSPAVLAQYLPPTTQSSKGPEGEGLVAERSGAVARHSAGFDGDDGLNDESPEDESRQGILPPNITSIYAPREVIGAIVQEERDKAQEEFQQRLKEAAEDSMRKVEVAYMPVAPSSAATVEPSESRQTATDTAALLHVSPAFFAAYGTGTGDAAVPPRPRPAAGDANNGNRSGAPHGPNQTLSASEQPENAGPGDNSDEAYSEVFGRGSEGGSGAYSRSFSGSGLGPLPAMAQSHSRRESGSSRYTSSAHSAAAAVAIPSGGVGAKKRDSGASRATSSEIAVLEPVADMASDVVPSRRESAVSQVTGGSGTPRPTDDALSDAVLSRHQSSGRQSSATRGAMAAATSGGHVSRRESAADRAADIEEDVARSAGPSRRESALSNAAEDAAGPSRRDSAASRHEPDAVLRSEGNASTSRRESPVSNGAVSGGIPSRRGSGASVGVSRAESERSRGTADAIPNLRASSVSAAVASAGPSRRDSSVSNLASEGQVPPAAARVVGSKAGTSRRGSSENMSSSACAASATAPSKRDSVGSLPVSGSEAPAMSRQESKASSYSVPPSEGVGGASSARGTASGEQGAINKLGRGSDSLGPLPLTPVAIQPNDVESKAALKAKDDEEELDVEEEESDREESEKEEEPEGDSDIEAAPPRKDEEDEEDEDEDEDEEEDGQQSGEVEARKQSAQLDSEDEGDDVRSSGDGSRTEDETEEEEEEEDVEEEDEEDAEEGDVEEGDGRK
ncbi:hypothetical protein Vretimale_19425 [Volvox reticuliferus]|uniref:Uncharacterized protein n=1 Tax=Volvox reticuliferus TaxID=1737510 RepID=A0A8J4M0J5_9CHLO|nr:hypothetical protein Vretimale_19425 [Volvox reticuliferus]